MFLDVKYACGTARTRDPRPLSLRVCDATHERMNKKKKKEEQSEEVRERQIKTKACMQADMQGRAGLAYRGDSRRHSQVLLRSYIDGFSSSGRTRTCFSSCYSCSPWFRFAPSRPLLPAPQSWPPWPPTFSGQASKTDQKRSKPIKKRRKKMKREERKEKRRYGGERESNEEEEERRRREKR